MQVRSIQRKRGCRLNSSIMKHVGNRRTRYIEKSILKAHMGTGISETACGAIPLADYFTGREGSSRESKRDYLHFLYIARGSLSEAQYFVHLAHRLGYLSPNDANALAEQTSATFACLHGLIRAVEREAGKFSKVIAAVSSFVAIGLGRFVGQ